MDPFSDTTPIATVEQFKTALLAVRDRVQIDPKALVMLQAHCRAPKHTATASQLAQAAGYPNYSSVNLHYGTFAHHIADALHYKPGPFADGNSHWWFTLAFCSEDDPQTESGNVEWIMRPELVQALQQMKWA